MYTLKLNSSISQIKDSDKIIKCEVNFFVDRGDTKIVSIFEEVDGTTEVITMEVESARLRKALRVMEHYVAVDELDEEWPEIYTDHSLSQSGLAIRIHEIPVDIYKVPNRESRRYNVKTIHLRDNDWCVVIDARHLPAIIELLE